MLLAEILAKRKDIEDKIVSLKEYLFYIASEVDKQDVVKIDETVTEIYSLLDEEQQALFTIDRVNHSIDLKIGSSKVLLSDAIRLRSTIKRKIDILSTLIDMCKYNKNSEFSIPELLKNKDKLFAEYNILTKAIKVRDWTMELTD